MTATGPGPAESRRPTASSVPPTVEIADDRGWSTTVGVLLIVAGVLAIVFPLVSSLAVTVFVGWLLMVSGLLQIVHAFGVRRWSSTAWYAVVGLILLVGGGLVAFDPLAGTVTLTMLLAAVFIAEGVIEIVAAFTLRDRRNWGWLLASGIVALVAGLLIALQLPFSALWAVGLIAGIKLIFSGFNYLAETGPVWPGGRASV